MDTRNSGLHPRDFASAAHGRPERLPAPENYGMTQHHSAAFDEAELAALDEAALSSLTELGRFLYGMLVEKCDENAQLMRMFHERGKELSAAEAKLRRHQDHSLDLERQVAGRNRIMLVNATVALQMTAVEAERDKAQLENQRLLTEIAELKGLLTRYKGNNETLLARLETFAQVAEEKDQALKQAYQQLQDNAAEARSHIAHERRQASQHKASTEASALAEVEAVRQEAAQRIAQIKAEANLRARRAEAAQQKAEQRLNHYLTQHGVQGWNELAELSEIVNQAAREQGLEES